MNDLVAQTAAFIRDRKLIRDGQRILIAVSGGLDSSVLFEVLRRLAANHRWQLTIAHFNHQLRGPAADEDQRLVRQMARAARLPFVVGRGEVDKFSREHGISIEMAARELRHEFLAGAARTRNIPAVALAHHADDQLELFFLRILRGAGSDGLAGMRAKSLSPRDSKITLVRPFLEQSRESLREFALKNNVKYSEDATNQCLDLKRNRIRHELLPLLRARYEPSLSRVVARLIDIVDAEATFAREAAAAWLSARTKAQPFDGLALAVQRRVLQMQLLEKRVPPDFDLIERLRKYPGDPFALDPRRRAARNKKGLIQIEETAPASVPAGERAILRVPLVGNEGRVEFAGIKFSWKIATRRGAKFARRPNVEHFDLDRTGTEIYLRHWKPGDRFQPSGLAAPAKLQDLFTNSKIPRPERHQRVIATTAAGEIFWIHGLRIGQAFKLSERTVRRLRWSWR